MSEFLKITFWILAPGNLEISQGIEYKLYAIFCTFAIEMYYHIVHNGSIPWVKILDFPGGGTDPGWHYVMSEIFTEHFWIFTPVN